MDCSQQVLDQLSPPTHQKQTDHHLDPLEADSNVVILFGLSFNWRKSHHHQIGSGPSLLFNPFECRCCCLVLSMHPHPFARLLLLVLMAFNLVADQLVLKNVEVELNLLIPFPSDAHRVPASRFHVPLPIH